MMNFRTDRKKRDYAKERRDKLRARGRCINGPTRGFISKRTGNVHGKALGKSGRCQHCRDRRKAVEVLQETTRRTIREVVEASAHLALDNAQDREALIAALTNRQRRVPVPAEPLRSVA